jgi:hypothetical protein
MQGIDLTVPQGQTNVNTTSTAESSRQDYGFDRKNLSRYSKVAYLDMFALLYFASF